MDMDATTDSVADLLDGRLLTPPEAAERLAVSERMLHKWRQCGNGPAFVRLSPRKIRYPEKELTRFLFENLYRPGYDDSDA